MAEIEVGNKTILFSYKTPVAYYAPEVGYFVTKKHWSATTTRHINKWLRKYDTRGGICKVEQTELDAIVG